MKLKQISNYSRYLISDTGRIFSKDYNNTGQFREMKIHKYKSGYNYVKLFDDERKAKKLKIYRLVAMAFIQNPENKITVNHKDGNKGNNNLENLEWATFSENQKHAWKNKLRTFTKKQLEIVRENIKKAQESIRGKPSYNRTPRKIELEILHRYSEGESVRKLSKEYKLNSSTVYRLIKRQ